LVAILLFYNRKLPEALKFFWDGKLWPFAAYSAFIHPFMRKTIETYLISGVPVNLGD
jgi:hypothetical protein